MQKSMMTMYLAVVSDKLLQKQGMLLLFPAKYGSRKMNVQAIKLHEVIESVVSY
jgi:hypothetical protein